MYFHWMCLGGGLFERRGIDFEDDHARISMVNLSLQVAIFIQGYQ